MDTFKDIGAFDNINDGEGKVLCAATAYDKKYYFNPEFNRLTSAIKDELQIMCVTFTEDVGGILVVRYTPEGELVLETRADEEDLLYDEIGAGLLISRLQKTKAEFFEQLELFYRVFYLGESLDADE